MIDPYHYHSNLRRRTQGTASLVGPAARDYLPDAVSASNTGQQPPPDEQLPYAFALPPATAPSAQGNPIPFDPTNNLLFVNTTANNNYNYNDTSLLLASNRTLDHERNHYGMDLPWWNGAVLIVATIVILCMFYGLKYISWKICGVDCCGASGTDPYGNNAVNGYVRRVHAPRTEEEEQQQLEQLEAQRAERRTWYQYYLQPYTKTLTKADFSSCKREVDLELGRGAENGESEEVCSSACSTSTAESSRDDDMNNSTSIMDSNNDDQHEHVHRHYQQNVSVALAQEGDTEEGGDGDGDPLGNMAVDDTNLSKHLVVWDFSSKSCRHVEAQCTICLMDYEEGDVIVQSALQEQEDRCMHCFHYECIMAWLVKGKKHCPYCRNWFVPPTPIRDQMKQVQLQTGMPMESLLVTPTEQLAPQLQVNGDNDDNPEQPPDENDPADRAPNADNDSDADTGDDDGCDRRITGRRADHIDSGDDRCSTITT